MKKLLLIAISILAFAFVQQGISSEPLQVEWSKTYGEPGIEYAGNECVQTTDGGYVMVGCTNFGFGQADFWLVKTDRDGKMQWSRTYGGSRDDIGVSIVQTEDDSFASVGHTNSFGAGDYDWWLIKTDATGNIRWDIHGGTAYDDYAGALIQTTDGGYAIAGYIERGYEDYVAWLVKIDVNGIVQFSQTFPGGSALALIETSDGGYAFTGGTFAYATGSRNDVWLVKAGADLIMRWLRTYGDPDKDDTGHDVIQTADGGYAITGERDWFGVADMWLIKTDIDGNEIWKSSYGGAGVDVGRSVVQTSDKGYLMAGQTSATHGNPADLWLVRTDSEGTMLWNFRYGGEQEDTAKCIVPTKDGGYAVFGDTNSFPADGYDFYLVKIVSFVTWEYVFKDPCRETILKISTDDHYFQFAAPEIEFPIKQDVDMRVMQYPSFTCITIFFEDNDLRFSAYALDGRFDYCIAYARDKQTGEVYLLLDRLGLE